MKRFAAFLASVALIASSGLGCGRSSLTDALLGGPSDASLDGEIEGGGPEGGPDAADAGDGGEGGPDGGHGCRSNEDCASTPSTPYCLIPSRRLRGVRDDAPVPAGRHL